MGQLELVADRADKLAAQQLLESKLKSALPSQGVKTIGYPGGNAAHVLYSRGQGTLWYAPDRPSASSPVPRYWNSFGIFDPKANAQSITVETNVPQAVNTGWVAGLFARDGSTGEIMLMHSGDLRGGRKGVSKTNFLAWANPRLIDVAVDANRYRSAILISPLNSPDLVDRIWRFVQTAAEFKVRAVAGEFDTAAFRDRVLAYKKYSREFSGRKRGQRSPELEYVTFHGDVVDAVKAARESYLASREAIVKTNLIDLGVLKSGKLTELYEVKTSCDRQSLYTGLGQLITHSASAPDGVERFLVLPANERISPDIQTAIDKQKISVRTFRREKRAQTYRITVEL